MLTYVAAMFLHAPQVLWTVLTAVIVTQLSVGRSLKATFDYFIGTLGGAIYSAAIATLVPHQSEVAFLMVLAFALGPLALLAALNSSFSVAPFTAIMVLLAPAITHAGPIESAIYRVFEVALGGMIGLAVSLFILPARAHGLAIERIADILDDFAVALRQLVRGFAGELDLAAIPGIQMGIGRAFASLETIVSEANRERIAYFSAEPEFRALLRTLLRLRHDLIIIGRTAVDPLPDIVRKRLAESVAAASAAGAEFLNQSAAAVRDRVTPPSPGAYETALRGYESVIAAIRRDGLTRELSVDALERLFALGFAFDQLQQNFRDLERNIGEFAKPPDGSND
ncbi:Fusaric acid resistance protein family protein [Methylocapsa palsarum]|uniref:Fusaric acid resistance protein family protein n=2 Tax=Methylocapsa palsarum TaxID=1612308 RepID=A0A1I4BQ15_9HYPH|nr:Fusaric acid resistance protein family protein [Methylocapsa palsarum]